MTSCVGFHTVKTHILLRSVIKPALVCCTPMLSGKNRWYINHPLHSSQNNPFPKGSERPSEALRGRMSERVEGAGPAQRDGVLPPPLCSVNRYTQACFGVCKGGFSRTKSRPCHL